LRGFSYIPERKRPRLRILNIYDDKNCDNLNLTEAIKKQNDNIINAEDYTKNI
jgi:hypothetical protein